MEEGKVDDAIPESQKAFAVDPGNHASGNRLGRGFET
jgi:hypothetical protein